MRKRAISRLDSPKEKKGLETLERISSVATNRAGLEDRQKLPTDPALPTFLCLGFGKIRLSEPGPALK